MSSLRTNLVTLAAVGAAAVGGATLANAASSTSSSSSSGTSAAPAAQAPTGQPPTGQPPSGQPPSGAPAGAHSVNGKTEKALTGDTASKVRAAALAKVPGTVVRVETNVDGSAPYEAHIQKSDGTQVEVQVSSDYSVAAVNTMGGHP